MDERACYRGLYVTTASSDYLSCSIFPNLRCAVGFAEGVHWESGAVFTFGVHVQATCSDLSLYRRFGREAYDQRDFVLSTAFG